MTFEEYLAIRAVNWSTLKELRRSPLHYRHRLAVPREDSATLRAGRVAHTAVFEPERFPLDYVVFSHENKGGKVVRNGKVWEAFEADNADRTIITPAEREKCLAMSAAVRGNPIAMKYLEQGKPEHVIQWRDPETKMPCKGRLDFFSESCPAIVDLKTTGSVAGNTFGAIAARLSYHLQLAFYSAGMKAVYGRELPVKIIAVEKEPPHDVAVFDVDADALYAGAEEVASLMVKLHFCRERNRWPGMYEEEQTLRLPPWALGDDEDDATGLDLVVSGQQARM